eukprot:CAMPEP_0184250394 /NCGR_PEP_ID=MMETSP0977-20130417/4539_1 /TAXON_ID=483370 /ORGANISM="non described non described, Strain CCMP2097" /LENGTH=122 /DNA_ID=CAMNT_0026555813 /DNA_START=86 /DNA_END=456 /DNA_ORIENTATION=-
MATGSAAVRRRGARFAAARASSPGGALIFAGVEGLDAAHLLGNLRFKAVYRQLEAVEDALRLVRVANSQSVVDDEAMSFLVVFTLLRKREISAWSFAFSAAICAELAAAVAPVLTWLKNEFT